MKINVGEIMYLDLQLFDGAVNKFVKASLYDNTGAPLVPASVELVHVANGAYKNTALNFPDVLQVTVNYEVYDDAGFTTKSATHANAIDCFVKNLDSGNDAILSKLDEVVSIVTSHDLNSQLIGSIQEDVVLTGVAIMDELTGLISDDVVLVGIALEPDDIAGDIFEDTVLTGNA